MDKFPPLKLLRDFRKAYPALFINRYLKIEMQPISLTPTKLADLYIPSRYFFAKI
jgi:hypothetical protein